MSISVKVSSNTATYLRKKLLQWGRENFSRYPWRYDTNPFHAIVSEIMLQRTKAEQVVSVYEAFTERFPNPQAVATASLTDIEKIIYSLGLKWRAKKLIEMSNYIIKNDGIIPKTVEELINIPGVGTYVATAYLSLHGHSRCAIVDANVVRFYGRFFGFQTGVETRRNNCLLKIADSITPRKKYREFNYALLDFTRKICGQTPRHDICPILQKCNSH